MQRLCYNNMGLILFIPLRPLDLWEEMVDGSITNDIHTQQD